MHYSILFLYRGFTLCEVLFNRLIIVKKGAYTLEEKEILNTFTSEIGKNIYNKRRLLNPTLEDLAELADMNNDRRGAE